MLQETSRQTYTPPGYTDMEDTNNGSIHAGGIHRYQHILMKCFREFVGATNNAKNVREKFMDYVNNEVKVHF